MFSLVLAPLALGELFAQQPEQAWPKQSPQQEWPQQGSSPSDPYNRQYAPDRQSSYDQQQYDQQQYGQPPDSAAAPSGVQAQPLAAEQLQQLVAPIALYPDALVAQILAASTYPTQVEAADRWRQAQGYSSPEQIAAGADIQEWDPSLKALTAFPQVLAMMDANLQWTNDLGTAYYNQPQDVLEAVQVMRQRAQSAGNLRSSPQESVTYDQGNIELAPPNPQVVYVPTYNPWAVYGEPVQPYPGFSLLGAIGSFLGSSVGSSFGSSFGSSAGSSAIRFGLGIAMSAFNHTPWGLLSWGLSWLTHSILFNNDDYYSQSTTVADWGFPRGGPRAYQGRREFARQPYDRASRNGLPNVARNYDGRGRESYWSRGSNLTPRSNENRLNSTFRSFDRSSFDRPTGGRPSGDRSSERFGGTRFAGTQPPDGSRSNRGTEGRSRSTEQAYDRTPSLPGRQQPYSGRGYANGFTSDRGRSYGRSEAGYGMPQSTYGRGAGYAAPSSAYRAPESSFQRGTFRDPSSSRQSRSGGFHLFGSRRSSGNFYGGRAPKASKAEKSFKPGKSFGGRKSFGGGHSHGGGHSGGHFGGGHHR